MNHDCRRSPELRSQTGPEIVDPEASRRGKKKGSLSPVPNHFGLVTPACGREAAPACRPLSVPRLIHASDVCVRSCLEICRRSEQGRSRSSAI